MSSIRGKLAENVEDHVVLSPVGPVRAILMISPGTESSYPHHPPIINMNVFLSHLFSEEGEDVIFQLQHGQQNDCKAVDVASLIVTVTSNDLRRDVEQRAHLLPTRPPGQEKLEKKREK